MKKIHGKSIGFIFLPVVVSLSLLSCPPPDSAASDDRSAASLAALGDSITMGIQDAGLKRSFQLNSFPYLVARQMGEEGTFEQPFIKAPGIGVPPFKEPLQLTGGEIISTYLTDEIDLDYIKFELLPLLDNLLPLTPYNNLGVNGAKLYDLRHTTSFSDCPNGPNFFFDIALRNLPFLHPDFGGKTFDTHPIRVCIKCCNGIS